MTIIRSLKMHLVLAIILITVYVSALERKWTSAVESGFMGSAFPAATNDQVDPLE